MIVSGCLLAATAPAEIIKVPAEQPTVQQAIDAASMGDTILVSSGTYFEHIDFRGKAVTVTSAAGAAQTIIDGSNTGTVVVFQSGESTRSVLTGFTIQHGSAFFGAGIMLSDSWATITRNIFRQNTQIAGGFGAAISANNSSPIIENNRFINNLCDTQLIAGVLSCVNGSSPLVINNIFERNPCRAIDMTLTVEGHPVVANNTVVQNRVGVHVDARVMTSAQLYANNIVRNGVGLEVVFLAPGNEPAWLNNLVFDNDINYSGISDETGVNGNISLRPKFAHYASGNFRLRGQSPAIDSGTLAVPNLPPVDFDGNPRVVDGDGDGSALPDMGAFEFVP